MALSKKMEEAMNDQINAEFFSAYLYQSMSSWLDSVDLPGMAKWMSVQAKEEMEHGMLFYNHVLERGGRVILKAIEAPKAEWESPLDAFTEALEHERYISRRIDDLTNLAMEEKDHASRIMLNDLVTEQVEEEDNAVRNVAKLKMLKGSARALYMLDRELGNRE
ncbi:MAG: ferritin [Dethiosulfovibrio peptidovorans]|nr:MAG: ferritin [Dethiosulfovibrio peptidovorans]